MARPRTFAAEAVLDAARDVFWERGYEATSIGDLEERTGLNRSSLYQAFGSKRALFDAALERYVRENVDPVLASMESPTAGRQDLLDYLASLSATFRSDPELAVRGCMIVNSMAELGARDASARAAGIAYRDRVTDAIANALRGAAGDDEKSRATADRRARMMCAAVMGALVSAHLDPDSAATVCDELAADLTED